MVGQRHVDSVITGLLRLVLAAERVVLAIDFDVDFRRPFQLDDRRDISARFANITTSVRAVKLVDLATHTGAPTRKDVKIAHTHRNS